MKQVIFFLMLIFVFQSCEKKKDRVVSVHENVKFEELKQLNLDKAYDNLLNPNLSTDEEYTKILSSWQKFHAKVNTVLKENGFSWDAKTPSVTIVNKVYFNSEGKVNYLIANILNDVVTKAKKDEYVKLLSKNINKLSIDLKRDHQFAQCGKVKYKNHE